MVVGVWLGSSQIGDAGVHPDSMRMTRVRYSRMGSL
jgi:hypothetical protein